MEPRPAVLNLLADDNMIYHNTIENFDHVLTIQGFVMEDLDPDTAHMMVDMMCTAREAPEHVSSITGRPYVDTEEESQGGTSRSSARSGYDTGDSEESRSHRH